MNPCSSDFPTQLTVVDFDPFAAGEVLLTAPATESQKEIWASVRMGGDANCAYNESQTLRLQGALQVEALQAALQSLAQRHESLHMTISPDGINLCINADQPLDVPWVDLSTLDEQERSAQLKGLVRAEVKQPFDLEHGPLFRAKIVRLHPQEHWVLLTAHHIICDGWSWGVLMQDLGKLYYAHCTGGNPDLAKPERFSDYAIALATAQGSEATNATESYWLNQFSSSVPVLDVPTDRTRPPIRTFHADREDWSFAPELVAQLKQISVRSGCSLMTSLLVGFEVFLYRLTGQTDLVVGIPAAGQAASGQQHLVGHCVNLLPLRSKVNPQLSFQAYLQSRRSQILDAYDHQEFTFGSLVKKIAIPRDPSRIPLVPVIFNIDQGLDQNQLSFAGLEAQFFSNPRAFENFEWFVNVVELNGTLTLEWQYNTNLFDSETIQRRMAEFETLLMSIVAAPDQSLSTLPLLPDSERQQLAQWNQNQIDFPQNCCLHQLVEQQVQRSPDAIAVVFEDQHLTYAQLDQRANQLAHYLHQLGVQPETLVGICCERSLDMIVGVLGILKAGGAYVPLDPAYPLERLSLMVEDSQVKIILTQAALAPNLPENTATVVCLDRDWNTIQSASATAESPPASSVNPEHLAYIIYTSGSTGKPKGVQIQHRGVVNLLWAVREKPGLTEQDVLLSVTTLSFDIVVSEIFLPLMVGARLVLVSREVASDGNLLQQAMVTASATFMQPTPATWRLLLNSGWQGDPHLKMISTGEALPRELANQLLSKGAQLWNLYGPTEITIWATLTQVEPGNDAIRIGRPFPNVQAYILDPNLQPVPIGVPGELHIGGAGLARGYLNRPELTAEKFIANPFSAEPDSRLYKTGDLARFLPNGEIECLGRIDHQVKVRGFRVELGEIESVLVQHPVVREAVVAVREETSENQRLVAYVVLHPGEAVLASELRQFLKQKLPSYMIPSSFDLLDGLALTPNGKIDRRGLPAPTFDRAGLGVDYVAPRSAIEQEIANIWQQVLSLKQVGIHDNFFEVGGHSLVATQIVSRLSQAFEVKLSLLALFQMPTITELSERIETLRWITQAASESIDNLAAEYIEGEL